ncbi:hypothetical protein N9937_01915 [bacterium]|nr:hypothetical protein [bacterium]
MGNKYFGSTSGLTVLRESTHGSGELVANGGFDSTTDGWTASNASLAVVSGELQITSSAAGGAIASQTIPTVSGQVYRLTAIARRGTAPNAVAIAVSGIGEDSTTNTTNTALEYIFTATASEHIMQAYSSATAGSETQYFDNISVQSVGIDYSKKLQTEITSDYNSGVMPGDIKGAWLADTDDTDAVGSELVTNGEFTTDTTGWTGNDATLSVDTNRLKITNNTTANGEARQSITTVAGETYVLRVTSTIGDSSHYVYVGTTAGAQDLYTEGPNVTDTENLITFTATGTTTHITLGNGNTTSAYYSFADDVSCRLADPDRSVNGNGLQTFGTITKTSVYDVPELFVDSSGTYIGAFSNASDLDEWTIDITGTSSATISANQLALSANEGHVYMVKAFSTKVGYTYVLAAQGLGVDATTLNVGNTSGGTEYFTKSLTASLNIPQNTFVATGTTVYIQLQLAASEITANGAVDNLSLKESEALSAYSGFSASNYFQQPYNSDLDFGVGDFYAMGWLKWTDVTTAGVMFSRRDATANIGVFGDVLSGSCRFFIDDGTADEDIATATVTTGTWYLFSGTRVGNNINLYLNRDLISSTTISNATGTLSDNDATLMLGQWQAGGRPHNGSLALWKMGKGAPTQADIEKIYALEKPLIEGRPCTLAGSSDAVVAMDWSDAKKQLLATTSGGLSRFNGLTRVSEDTSANAQSAIVSAEDIWETLS